jgi:hypothetical protein
MVAQRRAYVLSLWVRDMKVVDDAIHQQSGLYPGVGVREPSGAVVGAAWQAAADCAIGQPPHLQETAAVANRRAGCQP